MRFVVLNPDISYRVVTVTKTKDDDAYVLHALQKAVGGSIELCSVRKGCKFSAYLNEEGFLMELTPNYYAGQMLDRLNFNVFRFVIPATPNGNVVLLGLNDTSLTDAQLTKIEECHQWVINDNEDESCIVASHNQDENSD